jgi:HEAT repeat protein
MSQLLHEHCQTLVGGTEPERERARAALEAEEFVTVACRQAVLDGATAEEALANCHALLDRAAELEPGLRDREAVQRQIALAGVAILACRAATDGVPRSALTPWLARLFGITTPKPEEGVDRLVSGGDWLERGLGPAAGVRREDRDRARRDVEELLKQAHYSGFTPASDEERRLLVLLRSLSIFPPPRLDTIPEDGEVPDDYRPAVRFTCKVEELPEQQVRTLAAFLDCPSPRVRVAAALLVERMAIDGTFGHKNPRRGILRRALLSVTEDPLPVVRRAALRGIGVLSLGDEPTPRVLRSLALHLVDPSPAARIAAAESVAAFGPAAATPAVLDNLHPLLHEEAEATLTAGLDVAIAVGHALTDAHIDRVHELLNHTASEVARRAAEAIGAAGPRAARSPIVATLLDLFRDADAEVRAAAVGAYGRLGVTPNERALDDLGRFLHVDGDVAEAAIEAVGRIGPNAATHAILSGLARHLRDEETFHESIGSLAAMGQLAEREDVFGAISQRFASARTADQARWIVAEGRRLGPVGLAFMLRIVADGLGNPASLPRRLALATLSDVGADAATPEFLERLAQLLQHASPPVRAAAAEAVEFLGPAAATPTVLQLLTERKTDGDPDVRFRAEEALYRLTKRR